jgi:hypothetical protein
MGRAAKKVLRARRPALSAMAMLPRSEAWSGVMNLPSSVPTRAWQVRLSSFRDASGSSQECVPFIIENGGKGEHAHTQPRLSADW